LASRYGISKPLVLPNVSATRRATPSGRLRSRASLPEGIPLVLYQGYLKPGRGCAPLLAAARRVDECAVVFLGEGALKKELQRSVADYGLEARVRFVDMAQPDELLALTADADVGVCLIEPLTESLRLSLPNKLFEYLAAGVPVLASPLPEIERIVRGYDVGLTADPGDPVAVAEALQMMLSDGGARKRWSANCSRVMDDFDAQTIAGRFVDAYKNLLGAGERP
ncbi:MAG TPA: glycosyltransferase family 4 protein, partial [Rhodothermales bacterium]